MQLTILDSPTPSLVSSQHYHSTRSASMEPDPSPLRRQGRWRWEAPSKVASSERGGGGGSKPSKGRRQSATGARRRAACEQRLDLSLGSPKGCGRWFSFEGCPIIDLVWRGSENGICFLFRVRRYNWKGRRLRKESTKPTIKTADSSITSTDSL